MENISILISSCDAFKECWEPLIFSFEKYWPNCKFHKYIISNHKEIQGLSNTSFIKVGIDLGWASNMKNAIKQIPTEYILYFQDDYFLCRTVNNESIIKHIEHCESEGIEFLKINNDSMPRDRYRKDNSVYCDNISERRYTINTAVAIWKKSTLDFVCIPGQSGWDFEHNIMEYLRKNGKVIKSETLLSESIPEKGITYIKDGAIVKGKWTRPGVEFLQSNGFEDLIPLREVMGPTITFLSDISYKYYYLRIPIWPLLKLFRYLNLNI